MGTEIPKETSKKKKNTDQEFETFNLFMIYYKL